MTRLTEISGFEDYQILKYTPKWYALFGKYYPEKITLRRIIRFLLAMPCGYETYFLIKDNVVEGYCTVQSGKSSRFDYTSENDIIIGPYYILPQYQGKSLATKLIDLILRYKNGSYKYAFAYIKTDNIPSIKTCEKLGFSYYSGAHVTKFKADVRKTDDINAHYIIMRKNGDEI